MMDQLIAIKDKLLAFWNKYTTKQKTAYEIDVCDWSSDVCSSDLNPCTRVCLHFVCNPFTVEGI